MVKPVRITIRLTNNFIVKFIYFYFLKLIINKIYY